MFAWKCYFLWTSCRQLSTSLHCEIVWRIKKVSLTSWCIVCCYSSSSHSGKHSAESMMWQEIPVRLLLWRMKWIIKLNQPTKNDSKKLRLGSKRKCGKILQKPTQCRPILSRGPHWGPFAQIRTRAPAVQLWIWVAVTTKSSAKCHNLYVISLDKLS